MMFRSSGNSQKNLCCSPYAGSSDDFVRVVSFLYGDSRRIPEIFAGFFLFCNMILYISRVIQSISRIFRAFCKRILPLLHEDSCHFLRNSVYFPYFSSHLLKNSTHFHRDFQRFHAEFLLFCNVIPTISRMIRTISQPFLDNSLRDPNLFHSEFQ